MRSHGGRSVLAVVLAAIVSTTALADPGAHDDAGTGGDAGNVRAEAAIVQSSTWYAGSLRPNDVDWFASSFTNGSASCVAARATSSAAGYATLAIESNAGTLTAPMSISPDRAAKGGLAGMVPVTATLRMGRDATSPNFVNYDFRFDRVGIPSVNGDGPHAGDAGDSPSTAMLVQPGCVGGHLTILPSIDNRDVYAIHVPAGERLTYSLAANLDGVSLSLLDAVGQLAGPVLKPGEAASVPTESSTYYMSATRTNAVGDVGYVFGATVGPEPAGCKPYCMDS